MIKPEMTYKQMFIAITIPLYNQLHYTKICLDSIARHTNENARLIIVDNASSDGTAEYLADRHDITVIANSENRGCSGAWNQGVEAAAEAEWLVILNNDVICSPGWLEGLITAAQRWSLDIVCPAIRHGKYNYDIEPYSREYVSKMGDAIRQGAAHGICFMVNRRVFAKIGAFDENFRIGQYEDTDFFLRAKRAGFRLGTVGSSFLHHFGSVTQDSLKKSKEIKPYALENKAYFIRKWKLTWWQRTLSRNRNKFVNWLHSRKERVLHGHSLVEIWMDGELRYF